MSVAASNMLFNLGSIGRFQPASILKSLQKGGKERIEGGLVIKDPITVVTELNIEPYLNDWADKMRWWVSDMVVKPLAARIEKVDAQLISSNFEHLTCSRTKWSGDIGSIGVSPPVAQGTSSMFSFGGSNLGARSTGSMLGTGFGTASQQTSKVPTNLTEFMQQYGQSELCQERLKLEQYFNFPRYHDVREYIIERIKALARGGGLATYTWFSSNTAVDSSPADSSSKWSSRSMQLNDGLTASSMRDQQDESHLNFVKKSTMKSINIVKTSSSSGTSKSPNAALPRSGGPATLSRPNKSALPSISKLFSASHSSAKHVHTYKKRDNLTRGRALRDVSNRSKGETKDLDPTWDFISNDEQRADDELDDARDGGLNNNASVSVGGGNIKGEKKLVRQQKSKPNIGKGSASKAKTAAGTVLTGSKRSFEVFHDQPLSDDVAKLFNFEDQQVAAIALGATVAAELNVKKKKQTNLSIDEEQRSSDNNSDAQMKPNKFQAQTHLITGFAKLRSGPAANSNQDAAGPLSAKFMNNTVVFNSKHQHKVSAGNGAPKLAKSIPYRRTRTVSVPPLLSPVMEGGSEEEGDSFARTRSWVWQQMNGFKAGSGNVLEQSSEPDNENEAGGVKGYKEAFEEYDNDK
ncbi:hypothetical protein HDU76_005321, partial [Blyttiomyces sp. JEL0837]